MKARRIVAIVFIILAVAGVACGVWGLTNTQIAVAGDGYSGIYDLTTNSYDGTMGFSTKGGFVASMEDVHAQAESMKNQRVWGGFGAAALFAVIGIALLSKARHMG